MMKIKMKEFTFFLMIISAFLSMSDSHLYSKPDNINIPEMSKISELPIALEGLLDYINEVDQNLEKDSNDYLDHVSILREQYNKKQIMDNFLNKVEYLKNEIVDKVVHEAIDVVDVNKEVLTDMLKIFKDITKKIQNGARIANVAEVTNDIVQYTNLTLNNMHKDRTNKKKADLIYSKVKVDISQAENILRHNKNENFRRYLHKINQQTTLLKDNLKVIVQKANEIRIAMVDIIKWKTVLKDKFKNIKVHKTN